MSDTVPVTSPVTSPSISATRVPVVKLTAPVLSALVAPVPRANLSADSSHTKIAFEPVEPRLKTKPKSLAFVEAPSLIETRVSLTVILLVSTVVVVPET